MWCGVELGVFYGSSKSFCIISDVAHFHKPSISLSLSVSVFNSVKLNGQRHLPRCGMFRAV